MKHQDFILQVLRIFFPGQKTWLVKTLVLTGLAIIWKPYWEPIVIALLREYVEVDIPSIEWAGWILVSIGISVYIGNEWANRNREKPNSRDVGLYEEFLALFTKRDSIRFYKEHDFLASFHRDEIRSLFDFVEYWDNAEHEFVDPELECERKRVYEAGKALGMIIARNTVPIGNGPLMSVKPDHIRAQSGPTPEWVKRDARQIRELVPPFVEGCESLIRLGKRRLY